MNMKKTFRKVRTGKYFSHYFSILNSPKQGDADMRERESNSGDC
jgi:hypothetical protein